MRTEQQQRCIVKYQIGTYSGEEIVFCNENDDNEQIIAQAKARLRKLTSLPMYYESYKIIERENCNH